MPTTDGFTLFELLIVLVIITAMVTMTVPYATRSNESLKMEQQCRDLIATVRYAIDLATDTKKPTRIIVNPQDGSYLLEMATGITGQEFYPTEGFLGGVRYLGKKVRIIDLVGFGAAGKEYYLTFDPGIWPWSDASITLSTDDGVRTINVRGRLVELAD